MKNILILGFVSLLLFAVAFGLSVTLQQTKSVAKEDEKDKEKKGLKEEKEKPSMKDEKKKDSATESPKTTKDDTPVALAAEQKAKDEELKRRAERQAKKEAQQALILKDLREMRDEEDRVAKLIAAEVKLEKAREDSAPSPLTTPPVPKKGPTPPQAGTPFATNQPETTAKAPDPAEKKQLERLAVIYEAMPPETAAKLFQEQADSGKLDTVVKVMGYMRERASGKVISEIPDRALAAQIMDRMLQQKKPASPLPPN